MTKSQLLSAITAKYLAVSAPQLQDTTDGVSWYTINVTMTGLAADGSPIASRSNLAFYVFHEGLGDETAYYYQQTLQNGCDSLATASTGGQSYYNLFFSPFLRQRVTGCMIKAAVYFIGLGTVNQNYHWAQDLIKAPGKYLEAMMCELSSNGSIRAAGNATLDEDLDYAVNIYIPVVATAFGIVS